MTEPRKLRVFLCHASQDKPIVRELYQRLLAKGWIDPWLDEEKIHLHQNRDIEVEKALNVTDAVIILLSNHSVNNKGLVRREIRTVLSIYYKRTLDEIFVIPLRTEEYPLPQRLHGWHYVDLFQVKQKDLVYRQIFELLRRRFDQEASQTEGAQQGGGILPSGNKSNQPAQGLSTISIETEGGLLIPIYHKNTPLPFHTAMVVSTAFDDQVSVNIHLLLGENKTAKDNVSLGRYVYNDISAQKRGYPQIKIQFDIDITLILRVVAIEKSKGLLKALAVLDLKEYVSPEVIDPMPLQSETDSFPSEFRDDNLDDLFELFDFGSSNE